MPRKKSLMLQLDVETPAEKTTRVARDIINAETETREGNRQRLREARLEREAQEPDSGQASGSSRKTASSKARK